MSLIYTIRSIYSQFITGFGFNDAQRTRLNNVALPCYLAIVVLSNCSLFPAALAFALKGAIAVENNLVRFIIGALNALLSDLVYDPYLR